MSRPANLAPLLSTGKGDWRTPRNVFDALHAEFGFTVDAAASADNALLPRYWSEADDGPAMDWRGERVWCNPPYGRGKHAPFLEKAARCEAEIAVLLVAARTDTRPWHESVMPRAAEVRFVVGRLTFEGAKDGAPFPSAIVVFKGGGRTGPLRWRSWAQPAAGARRCEGPGCRAVLDGRADRRTCSARCRQALSRLRASVSRVAVRGGPSGESATEGVAT